jgi:DNA-binding XRE family transcriptional regulator
MQPTRVNATLGPPPGNLVLNVAKLNELRRAHELDSDTELAALLGVNRTTLYRVISGAVLPSNTFMARLKMQFPSVPLDSLFVVDRLAATMHQVPALERVAS